MEWLYIVTELMNGTIKSMFYIKYARKGSYGYLTATFASDNVVFTFY